MCLIVTHAMVPTKHASRNDPSSRYAANHVIEWSIPRGKNWPKVTAPYSSLVAYSPLAFPSPRYRPDIASGIIKHSYIRLNELSSNSAMRSLPSFERSHA